MLAELQVNNYTLIENSQLSFSAGFSAITGETGAGKSILLGALGLIRGDRAEGVSYFDKEKKIVVEATFQIGKYGLERWFQSNDLDFDEACIIRREINVAGKSRAFINDTPVTLAVLKELGVFLIDIHGQHETQQINKGTYQLTILDAFAQNGKTIAEYKLAFSRFQELTKIVIELREQIAEVKKNQSFNEFQLNELLEAKLSEKESLEELEEELKVCENAQTILEYLSLANTTVTDEGGVAELLQQLKTHTTKLAGFSNKYSELQARVESVLIETQDIGNEIQLLSDGVEIDEEKKQTLSERVDVLQTLLQKHGFTEISELIELRNQLENTSLASNDLVESLSVKEAELKAVQTQLFSIGKRLHQEREKAAIACEKEVKKQLAFLGMPTAELKFDLQERTEPKPSGITQVSANVQTNKGSDFKPIEKAASGGELSRIMLCLKAGVAKKKQLPTLIFDEIDTGISGEIAGQMASIFQSLGNDVQLICITHLPQIAAKANIHWKVFKEIKGAKTVSSIVQLSDNERVEELAGMLSGTKVTEEALANARVLLTH